VAELDIADHVVLHPTVEPDDPNAVEILTGRLNGPMDPSRPLWDFRSSTSTRAASPSWPATTT
jgi:hypothetical protein